MPAHKTAPLILWAFVGERFLISSFQDCKAFITFHHYTGDVRYLGPADPGSIQEFPEPGLWHTRTPVDTTNVLKYLLNQVSIIISDTVTLFQIFVLTIRSLQQLAEPLQRDKSRVTSRVKT